MSKVLVACFSATGTTRRAAEHLAQLAGADLYEIRPETPYTDKDLNYTNPLSRVTKEFLKRGSYRPPLADHDAPIAEHDTIFLCFPIWYYTAPTIISGFLEQYDFSGKKIVLFATSGGSDLKKCPDTAKKSAPNADIVAGCMLSGSLTRTDIEKFL